jgi:tetratricopeptide (TPR) repeat protein
LKLVLAIAAIMLIVGYSQASTLIVCPNGCDYTTIQSAVYAAKPGDIIEVHSGTYNESVILTKDVNFKGVDTGSGEPIVNGGLYKNGYDSSLRGFSFLDTNTLLPLSYKMENQNTMLYRILNASEIGTKALPIINKILQTNPKDAWAWFEKGCTLYYAQRYEDSIDALNESLKLDPYYYGSFNWIGYDFESLKKYNEALQAYNKALELKPKSASAWANKGNALYMLSKYDEAIPAFDKTIELDPNNGFAWYTKGNALKALGRSTEADTAFAKAKELGYT